MKHYSYNIIHHGKKIFGGTQKGSCMESALELVKKRYGIVLTSNGLIESNVLPDGRKVSVAIFA